MGHAGFTSSAVARHRVYIRGCWFRALGLGFGVWGLQGLGVDGLGFRVRGFASPIPVAAIWEGS